MNIPSINQIEHLLSHSAQLFKNEIPAFVSQHKKMIAITLIALSAIALCCTIFYYFRKKQTAPHSPQDLLSLIDDQGKVFQIAKQELQREFDLKGRLKFAKQSDYSLNTIYDNQKLTIERTVFGNGQSFKENIVLDCGSPISMSQINGKLIIKKRR